MEQTSYMTVIERGIILRFFSKHMLRIKLPISETLMEYFLHISFIFSCLYHDHHKLIQACIHSKQSLFGHRK